MIWLTALMCGLLGYQVTMPSLDNSKYTFAVHQGTIVRMNTQDGSMEKCDEQYQCQKIELKEDTKI